VLCGDDDKGKLETKLAEIVAGITVEGDRAFRVGVREAI